jgi:hypothetical protein
VTKTSGTLYIVSTPIGNLKDITYRAVETLSAVSLIAAEDTRHSKKLLNHYGIKKPLISYYEHNRFKRIPQIIAHLNDGKDVADYGYIKIVAQIYNNSEQMASASQFSPASTPTIKLYNEVSTTGYDANDDNTLTHYIAQSGFNEGFAVLQRADSDQNITGIVTQMIATQAGGKVVTNWFDPITR